MLSGPFEGFALFQFGQPLVRKRDAHSPRICVSLLRGDSDWLCSDHGPTPWGGAWSLTATA